MAIRMAAFVPAIVLLRLSRAFEMGKGRASNLRLNLAPAGIPSQCLKKAV
jgi:hypothetical protein